MDFQFANSACYSFKNDKSNTIDTEYNSNKHNVSSFRSNGVQTMLDLVKVFRGDDKFTKVQFNNHEAIFFNSNTQLWFQGQIADLVYSISMSTDSNIATTCRKYFNTIVKSYK